MKYLKQKFLNKANTVSTLKHWHFWTGFGATFAVFFALTVVLTARATEHVTTTFVALFICTLIMSFMIGDTVEEDGW